MNRMTDMDHEVGFDVPAAIGMDVAEIFTPALVLDLDAFEENLRTMRAFCREMGMRLRAHGKMHRCPEMARQQIEIGGAVGLCCQKVSEAETFVRAGITDVLISNQVRDPARIDRLARMPKLGARVGVCVDDMDSVAELSAAATRHGTTLNVLVEIDCGAGRCGVAPGRDAAALAEAVAAADGLVFEGLQAYHGSAQHYAAYADRREAIAAATAMVRETLALLDEKGLACATIGGGGTGSYVFEAQSGVYNELQCGSYAVMDAHYQRLSDDGANTTRRFANALFILTSIMSGVRPGHAVCDAGHKSHAIDSGMPTVFGRPDLTYLKCSDEHGEIDDPDQTLGINDRVRLVPGHCDPTFNLHDWVVGVRGGKVEALWPISARGKGF